MKRKTPDVRAQSVSRRTALVLALTAAVLRAVPASAAKLKIVKIGVPGTSIGFAPYYIAQDAGFFRENSIEASFVRLSDSTLPAALVTNGIQATPLAGSVTSGALSGFKVKSVGLLTSKLAWMLVANKSIESVDDLRGKKIITSPPKGAPNLLLLHLLQEHGVSPKDVKLLYIGSKAARQTLLLSGHADAIIDDVMSGLRLEEQMPELHTLVPSSQMPDQLGTGLGVSEALIKHDPALVMGMLKALWRADEFMQKQPKKASAILQKWLKVSPSIARSATEALVAGLTISLVPTDRIFASEAQIRGSAGGKKLTVSELKSTWDTRLATEVERELAKK